VGKIGEASVDVRADLRMLDKGLAAGEGQIRGFVATGNKLLGGLGALAAAGAGAGAGAALFDAAKKAADLGESVSKTKASFGKDAKVIDAAADEMADRFGIVKQSFYDSATTLGLLGTAAGMTSGQAARLGVEMTKLAMDLESFHNVPLEEAMNALRSGLAGESEPLRRFGVFLSEDAVKAEALRAGIAKSSRALTEQQKVLARLSLIKNSPAIGKAVGDLERTADSATNQMRKFMGDLENTKVAIGQNLIGPLTEALKAARAFGSAMGEGLGGKKEESGKALDEFGSSVFRAIGARFAAGGVNGYQFWKSVLKANFGSPDDLQKIMDEYVNLKRGKPGETPAEADQRRQAGALNPAEKARAAAAYAAASQKAMDERRREAFRKEGEKPAKRFLADAAVSFQQVMAKPGVEAAATLAKSLVPNILQKGLLRGAVGTLAAAAPPARPEFAGGSFKADEFAKMAIDMSLEKDTVKEQLEEQKEHTTILQQSLETLRTIAGARGGAVLRGPS
jgi:hypothetical protein